MDHREVELKFRVGDLEPVRRRLGEIGAQPAGASHEENLVFDDATGRLRAAGQLLRLRRDRRAALTFKSPLPDPRFKVRREVEVEVDSFDATRALLEALGYRVTGGYEKERETWRLGGATVLLDELAFGRFVEVEAAPAEIEQVAGLLGFDLAGGITRTYIDLQHEAQGESR